MRTLNASKRVCSEVISRLKQLTLEQRELLQSGSQEDQNFILWLAFCKRYLFIHDFAVEVFREKYLRLDLQLSYSDYDIFFFDKAEWHPEVERVTEVTRKKQRQFLFNILREVELVSEEDMIIPTLLSPMLIRVIAEDDPALFAIFPVMPADIQEWLP